MLFQISGSQSLHCYFETEVEVIEPAKHLKFNPFGGQGHLETIEMLCDQIGHIKAFSLRAAVCI